MPPSAHADRKAGGLARYSPYRSGPGNAHRKLTVKNMAEIEELQAQLLALKEQAAKTEAEIAELKKTNDSLSSDLKDAREINKRLILNPPSAGGKAAEDGTEEEEDERTPEEILEAEVIAATNESIDKALNRICGRAPKSEAEPGSRNSSRNHQR